MNKKSRIIMWVVIIVLALAAALTIYFTTRNGGARALDYDKFV